MRKPFNQHMNFIKNLHHEDQVLLLDTLMQFSNPIDEIDRKYSFLEELYNSFTLEDVSPDFFASISGTVNNLDYIKERLINHYISTEINTNLYRIRDILHDDRLTWGNKGLMAYILFYQDRKEGGGVYKVSKDRNEKIDKLLDEITSKEMLSMYQCHDIECECDFNNELIDADQYVLHGTLNFLLRDKKTSFNAKGILLFMLFHRYQYVALDKLLEHTNDKYNSTELGLSELVKLNYITEDSFEVYRITTAFALKTKSTLYGDGKSFVHIIEEANNNKRDILMDLEENGYVFDKNNMYALLQWLRIIPSTKDDGFDWNEIQTLRGLVYKELEQEQSELTKKTLHATLEKLSEIMLRMHRTKMMREE